MNKEAKAKIPAKSKSRERVQKKKKTDKEEKKEKKATPAARKRKNPAKGSLAKKEPPKRRRRLDDNKEEKKKGEEEESDVSDGSDSEEDELPELGKKAHAKIELKSVELPINEEIPLLDDDETIVNKDTSSLEMHRLVLAVEQNDVQTVKKLVSMSKEEELKKRKKCTHLIKKVDTGDVSEKAFGVKIRKVQMMRGGRQGDNALVED